MVYEGKKNISFQWLINLFLRPNRNFVTSIYARDSVICGS